MDVETALQECFRILFLINVPILLVAIIAGTFVTCLMSVTNVHEKSISYAARLVAIVVLCYLMLETISGFVLELARGCFG